MVVFPILYHATCACGDQNDCLWLSCLVTFEYLTYMHEICATRLYLQNPSTRHHIQCWLLFSNNGCELRRAAEPFGTYRKNRHTKKRENIRQSQAAMAVPRFKLKVAAAHLAPVYMDKEATIKKVIDTIRDAGAEGIELLAFPETFIPGYPV